MVYQPTGRPNGRPISVPYNEETANLICEALIEGHALYKICKLQMFPSLDTVYRWLNQYPEFAENYARARELQQERAADEILDIADNDPDPQRARNRIDARKWRASKLAPKKFGDKTDINLSGSITIPEEQLDARIAELLRKGGTVPALAGPGPSESEE